MRKTQKPLRRFYPFCFIVFLIFLSFLPSRIEWSFNGNWELIPNCIGNIRLTECVMLTDTLTSETLHTSLFTQPFCEDLEKITYEWLKGFLVQPLTSSVISLLAFSLSPSCISFAWGRKRKTPKGKPLGVIFGSCAFWHAGRKSL